MLNLILKDLSHYSVGFLCVTKIENHYYEASHRIFVKHLAGTATFFWKDKQQKLITKSKLVDKFRKNGILYKALQR